MKKWLVLTSPIVLAMLASCINPGPKKTDLAEQQMLDLALRFEQSTYHSNQSIRAFVTLRNIGDTPVIVNSRMAINLPDAPSPLREIVFIVITPTGENYIPDVYMDSHMESKYFITLEPGESIEKFYDLDRAGYVFSEPGTYRIFVNYQNNIDPSYIDTEDYRIAWKGELNSNEVLLTIIP